MTLEEKRIIYFAEAADEVVACAKSWQGVTRVRPAYKEPARR